MLQLCGNIFFRKRIAHIEAPLQRSVVALLANGLALLRLILLDLFCGRDGQITILKAQLNLILLEARQVRRDSRQLFSGPTWKNTRLS